MTIAILTEKYSEEELGIIFPGSSLERIRVSSLDELARTPDLAAVFDLDFQPVRERIEALKGLGDVLVFVNSVIATLAETDSSFIRINGWPGFLEQNIHELATSGKEEQAAVLYTQLGHAFRIVPDTPGLIGSRILATIINEAWYTWQEGVSGKEEIDTAMKLGTNYPMGPFEWGERIGLQKIEALLTVLSRSDTRYTPATSLRQAIGKLKYD